MDVLPRRLKLIIVCATCHTLASTRPRLSAALAPPWRSPRAGHDPGKVVLDLGIMLAAGGDCPADVAGLRAQPGVFGGVVYLGLLAGAPGANVVEPGLGREDQQTEPEPPTQQDHNDQEI